MESKTYSPLDCLQILLHETVLNHTNPDYNRQIDWSTYEFIRSVPEHSKLCYVQTADQWGEQLTYPILWSLNGWRKNVESWRLAKAKADADRDASFVFKENHKRIVRALCRVLEVQGDPANVHAHRKLKTLPITHPYFTEFLQVKLITNVSEIP